MAKGRRGTGEPYLRGTTYWIKYYVNGEPIRESTGKTSKTEAIKILNQKRSQADAGEVTAARCTIDDLLDLHIAELKRRSRASVEITESRVRKHVRPALGRILARKLRTSDIEDYIDDRLDEEAQPATINRELSAVKTALLMASKRTPPLISKVIDWEPLDEENIREGFLDQDDYRRLLRELPDDCKLLLVFGYHYGIRKTELLGYRWSYVDWHAKEIRVPQPDSKNKQPKVVPFYGDVPAMLEMERTRHDSLYPRSPWIFSRNGEAIKDFRKSWELAVGRAKLQDSLGLFHDLRRSAARNMLSAGLDEKMAMKIGGWKTDSVFRRYRIVARKDLHRAADMMDRFFAAEDAAITKVGTKVGTIA